MSHIELIAECSTNAGGNLSLAKEFIRRFADAGADFVKFQHTRVKHLRPDDPQYAWFKRAEFTVEQFAELKAECERCGTQFLTTVYNAADVPDVVSLGLDTIKIGSGEAQEMRLADAVRRSGLRAFVSMGITQKNRGYPTWGASALFFRCVSRYPHPSATAVTTYPDPIVGYSDHSIGIDGCCVAVALGAKMIEKHVQLPNQARPCRSFEATVEEFKALRTFADEGPTRFIGRWQHA